MLMFYTSDFHYHVLNQNTTAMVFVTFCTWLSYYNEDIICSKVNAKMSVEKYVKIYYFLQEVRRYTMLKDQLSPCFFG
jgi:hypothetical protein